MRVVGIDPDTGGALAFLDFENRIGAAYHLPTHDVYFKSKKKTRARISDVGLIEMFTELYENPEIQPSRIFIEEALAFQKDSPKSMLTNGITSGKIIMGASFAAYVADVDTSVEIVAPVDWKGAFGLHFPDLPYRQKKVKAVEFATDLFPGLCSQWPMVKNTSLAEATLIALYGAMKAGVKLPPGKNPTHSFKVALNPILPCLT